LLDPETGGADLCSIAFSFFIGCNLVLHTVMFQREAFSVGTPLAITMTIKISIDCMGGDHGPSVTIPAAVSFVKREPDAELILVGLEDVIRAELKKHHADAHPRLSVVHASEQVTMDDPLEVALRRKKDSSMRVAIEQVKDGKAQASVSAGNTGALMAVARYVLKTMSGVDRPAICSIMPNQKAARPTCWTWAPTSIANRTTAPVCHHGLGAGVGHGKHRTPDHRPAQRGHRGHQGQRRGQGHQQAAAGRP
jgi:hypothetical protein